MKIHNVSIKNFTVFKDFSVECGGGVNVIIGGNGTGKTLFLKVCRVLLPGPRYTAEMKSGMSYTPMWFEYFPATGPNSAEQAFYEFDTENAIKLSLNDDSSVLSHEYQGSTSFWPLSESVQCVYIPPKDITENAQGFRSLYSERYIAYDRLYYELITALCLPPLRDEHIASEYQLILEKLEKLIGGKPVVKWNDKFFLQTSFGELDFSLVAEGYKKLAQVWLLIKNGSIAKDSILLWDEPDANLNPVLIKEMVPILVTLARQGVQVFIATHNNFLLNELELWQSESHTKIDLRYLAFYKDGDGEIRAETASSIDDVNHNCIAQAFGEQYDRKYQIAEDAW